MNWVKHIKLNEDETVRIARAVADVYMEQWVSGDLERMVLEGCRGLFNLSSQELINEFLLCFDLELEEPNFDDFMYGTDALEIGKMLIDRVNTLKAEHFLLNEPYMVTDPRKRCGGYRSKMYADYKKLVEILGPPNEGPETKISGEWVLENREGKIYTLYDWKMTDRYCDGCPTVEEFRNSGVQEFHIGGDGSWWEFSDWLENKLKAA